MNLSQRLYDAFSKHYREYSNKKNGYIEGINNYIENHLKGKFTAPSIIDLGAADGVRGRLLADRVSARSLTLVDNSQEMVNLCKKIPDATVINSKLSEVLSKTGNVRYDVVFCLWNVLGHIDTRREVIESLKVMRELVNDEGLIFVDVSNRYNINHYGLKIVASNLFKDLISYKYSNGDFSYNIKVSNTATIPSRCHFFTKTEFETMILEANLKIIEKKYVNYASGVFENSSFKGQLFYILSK